MSVTAVNEIYGSRKTSVNSKGERTHRRIWHAKCDSPYDDGLVVLDEVGVVYGSIYATENSTDVGATCNNIDVELIDKSTWLWQVTATYGPEQDTNNPLNEPPSYQWGVVRSQKLVDYDVFSTAILNAAGDPYEQGVQKSVALSTLTVQTNEKYFSWNTARAYNDCTNSNSWKGAAPGTLRVTITASDDWHQEIGEYWHVTYFFEHSKDPQGWDAVVLNKGFNEVVDGVKKKIMLEGKEPSEAQLLDKNGKHIPQGSGQPVFNYHRIYNRVPFNFPF